MKVGTSKRLLHSMPAVAALMIAGCTIEQGLGIAFPKGTLSFQVAGGIPASVTAVSAVLREGTIAAPPTTVALTVAGDVATATASVLAGKVHYVIEARNSTGTLVMQSLPDSVTVGEGTTISVSPVLICLSSSCDGAGTTGNVAVSAISPTTESESNGSIATADTLPEYATTSGKISAGNGRIATNGDEDYFSFVVAANSRVSVTLFARRADAANTLDAEISLIAPTGAVISASNDCGAPSSLDSCVAATQPLVAGRYVVRVSSRVAGSTGRYTVVVNKAAATSNLLLEDDFSGTLAKWTTSSDGGTWAVSEGTLVGEYDIVCGSNSCSHSDILLANASQPGSADWRMEVQFTSVRYPYSSEYDLTYAHAVFSVYASATEKMAITVGWGTRNVSMPATLDSVQYGVQIGMPWVHQEGGGTFASARWSPGSWNTAAVEKRGNSYTVYFNGQVMQTFTKTFTTTPKVGLHIYGKLVADNFRLYQLP
jgi:hypothetical protein